MNEELFREFINKEYEKDRKIAEAIRLQLEIDTAIEKHIKDEFDD